MATINEELKAADAAKAAIDGPTSEAINVPRKATKIAAEQFTSFPSEGPLNDARYKVGLALSPVISALKASKPSREEQGQGCNRCLDKGIGSGEALTGRKKTQHRPRFYRQASKPVCNAGSLAEADC